MVASAIFDRLSSYLASKQPNKDGWYDAHCPLHVDTKRSAGFNFDKGIWSCRAGCGSGSLADLVDTLDRETEDKGEKAAFNPFEDSEVAAIIEMSTRKRRQDRPAPSEETIQGWSRRLLGDKALLKKFQQRRGLSVHTIRTFQIGWSDDDRAYTVPIKSGTGSLLNVRLYRIEDDQGTTKIWSWGGAGMDASAIYPEKILKDNDVIVIDEGEWDALMLNQHGIPAVSGTTGARQWQAKWNRKFADKEVYICYDRDVAGEDGAIKVAQNLVNVALAVYMIKLPLEWRETGGLDVSDYFLTAGATAEDFRQLMADAEPYAASMNVKPIEVTLQETLDTPNYGRPMTISSAQLVGRSENSFGLPRSVTFTCDVGAGTPCVGCPMNEPENVGRMDVEFGPNLRSLLGMYDVNDKIQLQEMRTEMGAHQCRRLHADIKKIWRADILKIRTSTDHYSEGSANKSLVVVAISEGKDNIGMGASVAITGTSYRHPKDQYLIFQAWKIDALESSIDRHEVEPGDLSLLLSFQPGPGQRPLGKMKEIADDLADHTTKILGRPTLHMAMDMVWHSVLSFSFNGEKIERGWLDLCIVGDPRTGKSEVAKRLTIHYGYGNIVSCETSSIPGIIGTTFQLAGAWTVEWGAIPMADRRLMVLDEAAGLSREQIGQLSDLRSSGVARITKAASQQAWARTRLVWLSNPRDAHRRMDTYLYGIDAIIPLIGQPADIARFDFAMTVKSSEVSKRTINTRRDDGTDRIYSSEACHALIRWVWSRGHDDVMWESNAEQAVLDAAIEMSDRYTESPPLVQGANIRVKIARIAVAIAARTFSTDSTHTKIIVRKVHVEDAVTFLNYIYGERVSGYSERSRKERKREDLANQAADEVKDYLYNDRPLLRFLTYCTDGTFRKKQLEEQLGIRSDQADTIIKRLAQSSMITAEDINYRISNRLIEILREAPE